MTSRDHVLSDLEMLDYYGAFYSKGTRTTIDKMKLPPSLRALYAYAEFWGEPDDEFRADLIADAPAHVRENLAHAVRKHLPLVERWLNEIASDRPSREYVALNNLLVAFHDPDIAGTY
jgi:hypothetical protein